MTLTKRVRLGLLLGTTSAACLALLAWFLGEVFLTHPKSTVPPRIVSIPNGYSAPQIASLLRREGVLDSEWPFLWYVRFKGLSEGLKAGEYELTASASVAEVTSKLHQGECFYHRVTIPEGLTIQETVEQFLGLGIGSRRGFETAIQRGDLVHDLDSAATDLEGYVFPDTYFITRDMSEEYIMRAMVGRFRQIWDTDYRRRAQELQMTVREVTTLASLIEKETGLNVERALVSAVFHNRLLQNIRLACDPTVIYAVKRIKPFDGIIHQSDLRLDSPYNTYLYPGLPPGPIANPGHESIRAALIPAPVDYLYFVSKNDGSHFFSKNYRMHQRAVRKYRN